MQNIGIIFGGKSGEHLISVISAKSIFEAINKAKFKIIPIYISQTGKWFSPNISKQILQIDSEYILKKDPAELRNHIQNLLSDAPSFNFDFSVIDVAFPALHGSYGEDGTIQGLLEIHNIPYVGCDVVTSAICMDKCLCKRVLQSLNIPLLPFIEIFGHEFTHNPTRVNTLIEQQFGYPVFIKPAKSGSSVGISKVKEYTTLADAIKTASMYDTKILIEKGLDKPREIEVGVLGYKDHFTLSALGEIIPANEFYDFTSKYISDKSELFIPPRTLYPSLQKKIETYALEISNGLNVSGLSRIDFLIDKESNEVYLNEVNTMPGFTSISMYPKLFMHKGINYSELIDKLINIAQTLHFKKSDIKTIF